MLPGSPVAVVLAAGMSRRMGHPKALLDWDGQRLIQAHIAALPCPGIVVTGAHAALIRPLLEGMVEVHNPSFASTQMGESVVLALRNHQGPAIVVPVDTVPQPAILQRLLECSSSTVPLSRQGKRGHPIWLDHLDVERLCAMENPNLRVLMTRAMTMSTESTTCALDFDTPQDLHNVRKVMRSG